MLSVLSMTNAHPYTAEKSFDADHCFADYPFCHKAYLAACQQRLIQASVRYDMWETGEQQNQLQVPIDIIKRILIDE